MRLDGREKQQLFRGDRWILDPESSPGGKLIAFVSVFNGFPILPDSYEIEILSLDGREPERRRGRGPCADLAAGWNRADASAPVRGRAQPRLPVRGD
jgi:hypothetical protein